MKDAPVRHRIEQAVATPLIALLRALPHGAARRLGRRLGDAGYPLLRRRRRVALDNLALALPELDRRERHRVARRCFRHFGAVFADAISATRFDRVELCRRIEARGVEHLQEAERRGRGVVLLTAHYGDWEITSPYIIHLAGPTTVVGRPLDNPHLDRKLGALRERFGARVLPKRGSVREMFRVLREGGRLGLLIDQRVRREEGIEVEFFGRPAVTSPIAAKLATRSGAPIVPVFGDHVGNGGYRVEILEAIEPGATDDDEAIRALTRRCLEVYERVIRRAPERWLWMHRRWLA